MTKFGDDWLIFVDARVLTGKVWTDGQRRTVSDHNSSGEQIKMAESFSKKAENTVGKGEIASYKQYLLFQCFQKTCTTDM